MPEILVATKSDLDEICTLEQKNFDSYEQYSLSMLNDCFSSNNYLIYKLVSNNQIVSYIILLKAVDEYEILKICTSSEYRKQGYAGMLLKLVIEKERINKLFLEVRESNIVAQKFYQANNFKIIGKRTKYYGNEDAILMEYSFK